MRHYSRHQTTPALLSNAVETVYFGGPVSTVPLCAQSANGNECVHHVWPSQMHDAEPSMYSCIVLCRSLIRQYLRWLICGLYFVRCALGGTTIGGLFRGCLAQKCAGKWIWLNWVERVARTPWMFSVKFQFGSLHLTLHPRNRFFYANPPYGYTVRVQAYFHCVSLPVRNIEFTWQ